MKLEKQEALAKAMRYCAYQERAPREVAEKLKELGQSPSEVTELLQQLKDDDFVNEQRFAKLFSSGKFRIKQWGKRKIQGCKGSLQSTGHKGKR